MQFWRSSWLFTVGSLYSYIARGADGVNRHSSPWMTGSVRMAAAINWRLEVIEPEAAAIYGKPM
jgi:hypothetical protein